MPDHVISVRDVDKDGNFVNEPGEPLYLRFPTNRLPKASHAIDKRDWIGHVLDEAKSGTTADDRPTGDILMYVHGYNNDSRTVMKRHRTLKEKLGALGYNGAVVSFDWPSAKATLNYLEDRTDAKTTAFKLVTAGILPLAKAQDQDCQINVHLLGHSMGAYVIREAMDDADDRPGLAAISWTVSQVCLTGGDISSGSMESDNARSSSLYRRAVRITNYFNPYDGVLKLSGVKRIGVAPRVGRIGLPANTPGKAVDVDCGEYYFKTYRDKVNLVKFESTFAHGWYIDDDVFVRDLFHTLEGNIDRNRIPTREPISENRLALRQPEPEEALL